MKTNPTTHWKILRIVSLLAPLWIPPFIFAEDVSPTFYFRENPPSSFDTREGVLEGIKAEFPKAVKIFEFHDEGGNFILLKLTAHSYATMSFSGMAVAEFVSDAKDSRAIPVKSERRVTGRFQYQTVNQKNDGGPTTIGYTWTLFARELDLKDAKKLLFCYQFGEDKKNSAPAKKFTVAVDWEAERAEGVKIALITGDEKGLEP